MAKVTKDQLAEVLLSKKYTEVKKTAHEIVNTIFDEIINQLKKGNDVAVAGFGVFRVSKRKERMGINPKTGEKIKIPAKRAVKFRAAKDLKQAVL
ncbi:MAG: HU family DNA-binding protein [Minisyncoccia bacterium]